MQRIDIGSAAPLSCLGHVHYKGSHISVPACTGVVNRPKSTQFHCPNIDTVNPLCIQQHPSVLEADIYEYEKLACSSRVVDLPNAAEIIPTVALQKRQGIESEKRC